MTTTLVIAAAAALAVMLAGWVASIPLRDVSIVDALWGVAIGAIGWVAFAGGDGDDSRRTLMVVLVTLWAARLAVHITRRKLRHPGEDKRYASWRTRFGDRFVFTSLGRVFLLQAAIGWVVGLSLIGATDDGGALGALDVAAVLLWLVGMVFESVGDEQLERFKADPANRGQVMRTGLWRYTRHPNYFGEACIWWGMFCLALAAGAWWAVVSPLVVTLLVTRVSGVAHLERNVMSQRPGYEDYVARTSAFVPRPPK